MHPEPDFPADLRALEDDYALIREIGQGGMAAVYLARRRRDSHLVAIKAIRARYLDDPDALQRFAREARTVAELSHPNIVRTEAIEQIGDRAIAIIMEHIAGGTVRDRLREYGAFSAEDAESVLRDVASALGYAHRRGIVHRDVKPENVFLDERTGRALLSDFGIARRIEGDIPITLLGAALGTPQYMSPEQIDGAKVDGRSDIYSLGVLGWELLTGRRPWAGENLYTIIYKQKHEELARITTLRPRVPANLLFAIERALAKNREQRWQTVEEFLEQLTYSPPPVLAQSYPAGAQPQDDETTIRFRREPSESAPPHRHATAPAAVPPVSSTAGSAAVAARSAPSATSRPPDVTPHGTPHVTHATSGAPARPQDQPARPAERPRPSSGNTIPGRRLLKGAALVVPLAVGGVSLYVVLDRGPSRDRGASGSVTTSGGTVALDTQPSFDSNMKSPRPIPERSAPPAAAPPASAAEPAPPSAQRPEPRVVPTRSGSDSGSVPVRPEAPRIDSSSAAGPSPRCRVAAMADQRACLLAYIAVNDAMLQRVYDSLIVELRRAAGVPRGRGDPASVARLRVEQRAWIAARDRECTRSAAPGSVPFWAQPLSECFASKSTSRAAELRERLDDARAAPR